MNKHSDIYLKTESYYSTARNEIISLLDSNSNTVFEIGCGSGDTLHLIKSLGLSKWVGGMEIVPAAAEKARRNGIDLVVNSNIEDCDLPVPLETLDVILCLDVLEHLVDPWSTLRKLNRYLRNGGVLICSLPNVRNLKVTLPLLFGGNWSYTDWGLLDRTHLRFFTRKTAINLVEESGYCVNTVTSTGIKGKMLALNLLTLGLFKEHLDYQYLIKATKIS